MIDELRRRFLPRFVESGRQRTARALSALEGDRGAPQAAAELHALAGEAAVLELFEVASKAREAEAVARRASAAGPADARGECARMVGDLLAAIDRLQAG